MNRMNSDIRNRDFICVIVIIVYSMKLHLLKVYIITFILNDIRTAGIYLSTLKLD